MSEKTRFMTDDEIELICINTGRTETYNFVSIDEDGLRRYKCSDCGRERIFPASLPDSRFENDGYNLVEYTNKIALEAYYG
jgi:uncharacterized OB-fold protein